MSVLWPFVAKPNPADVVHDYGPKVYRHLKRIFGPSADVEDVYQQVFVEILRALPSFRGAAKLGTWVRRITWNVAYQEMRVNYRNKEDVGPVDALASTSTEAHLEHRDVLRRWYALLGGLDPKLRVVATMYELEGMTLKEISEALGRPLPTVASQLNLARSAILAAMPADGRTQSHAQATHKSVQE